METMVKLFVLSEEIYQQWQWVMESELCYTLTDFKVMVHYPGYIEVKRSD